MAERAVIITVVPGPFGARSEVLKRVMWNGGERRLVVIDEALDIVEESQAELDGLRRTLAAIPSRVRHLVPQQIGAIEEAIELLDGLDRQAAAEAGAPVDQAALRRKEPQRESIIGHMLESGAVVDMGPLRAALGDIRFDMQEGRANPEERKRLAAMHDRRIKALHHLFASWVYYAKLPHEGHTLNTARLLVPENSRGAVVLDATASSNVIYRLFEKATVVTPPVGVRNYKNVTLHVSKGHKTGKVYLRTNAKEACTELVTNLNATLGNDRRAFVVCHKDVEPTLAAYDTTFEMRTGHWGAIDGSNEWRDCDVEVIFGLPHRPDTWTANTFFALQGVKDTAWLQASGRRPWKEFEDIRSALKVGQLVTEVVQAINRIRCRKVIDADGNCPEADVYFALPGDKVAEEVLVGVVREMPGINVVTWQFDGVRKKATQDRKKPTRQAPRRIHTEKALVKFVETMMPGRASLSEVSDAVGSNPRRIGELLAATNADPESLLWKAMAHHGMRYRVSARGGRAALMKE